ncbi:MAG TPA: LytTR family transcriptional regulator DNA-binding domain-containing protein [Prolixibacteraceae bacterium]|jgi:two-component system LytT family response regulator
MNKIRTLIIDDESLARDLLRHYLSKDERVEIIGECANGFEAVLAIQELNPDLIFLDIQMPKITGFEMLELMPNPPIIIFSTAYDQYAIRAFEANAIDYLLKPYPFERVVVALNKAVEKLKSKTSSPEISRLIETHDDESGVLNRVVVKSGRKIQVIPVESIYYIESQDDFVMIYCAEGHFMKQKTMKFFEQHLDEKQFVRIHRSYLLNLAYISEIQQYEKESWIVLTKQGAKLKVSKAGYANLKEKLK